MTFPKVLLITDQETTDIEIFARLRRVLAVVEPANVGVMVRRRTTAACRTIRSITAESGAWLIAHTDIELAKAMNADGIHMPSSAIDSMSVDRAGQFRWRSVAVHSDNELARAVKRGANAALISPIFSTPNKGAPRGEEALASAAQVAPDLHRVALGGIDESNVGRCVAAGASGVAVVRAWTVSERFEITVKALLEAFR